MTPDFEFDSESRGAKAAEALARAVNGFTDDDYRQFAEALCHREHRTLQQNAARAVYEAIKQWAKDYETRTFDLRNEDTVTFARFVVDRVKEAESNAPCRYFGFRHV